MSPNDHAFLSVISNASSKSARSCQRWVLGPYSGLGSVLCPHTRLNKQWRHVSTQCSACLSCIRAVSWDFFLFCLRTQRSMSGYSADLMLKRRPLRPMEMKSSPPLRAPLSCNAMSTLACMTCGNLWECISHKLALSSVEAQRPKSGRGATAG